MSTWEDLVVNEPQLSSLPPALASSIVKELQGTRGVIKVELQNQYDMFFSSTQFQITKRNYGPFFSIPRARTWQEGKPALVNSEEEVVEFLFSRWLHRFLFSMFISTKGALGRPMTYDIHPIQPQSL